MPDSALEKGSQSPLYQQLMTRLRNEIATGAYPPGARIPTEQELCESYHVSRVTVRKAMLDLVRAGLLVRRQGKGTFVADARLQRDLQHVTSFSDACRGMGRTVGARVLECRRVPADAEDAARLRVAPESDVLEIVRLRLCDAEPVMLEINRFPPEYAWLADEPLTGSLYERLRARGVEPSRAEHDISLGHATQQASRALNTAPGEALLVLDETVFDQRERPLHTSRQWIRGDRFTFRI